MSGIIEASVILLLLDKLRTTKEKKDTDELLKIKDPKKYSKDVLNVLDIITTKRTYPVGSYKYKIHKYPGDIDIFESIIGCCSFNEAKLSIMKKIQTIAKKVKKSKIMFLGDFKAGVDDRMKVYIGTIKLGKIKDYNEKLIKRDIKNLYDQRLITRKFYNTLNKLVKSKLSVNEWEYLNEVLRSKYIVRWTNDEIIKGWKILPLNKKLYLDEALTHNSTVKIDLLVKINNRFTEVTNYFFLIYRDRKKNTNILNAELADYIQSINEDIYKYSSKEHKNSLKLVKRLFNKYTTLTNKQDIYSKELKKMAPLFDSEAARLSQIVEECTVLQDIQNKVKSAPQAAMKKQIQSFKERIKTDDTNLNIPYKVLEKHINSANKFISRRSVNYHLDKIKEILSKEIENYSAAFLKKNKIKPIKD